MQHNKIFFRLLMDAIYVSMAHSKTPSPGEIAQKGNRSSLGIKPRSCISIGNWGEASNNADVQRPIP